MSSDRLRKLITEYLDKARLMQVATSNNNQPWACSVYFAYDAKLSLYWISKPTCRHSQEILKNEKVAGAIVLPHKPGDSVRGIQFEGVAKELADKQEIKLAMSYYSTRYGMNDERVQKIIENTDGHMCYKITPSLFVLYDQVNFPENPRQEYKLK